MNRCSASRRLTHAFMVAVFVLLFVQGCATVNPRARVSLPEFGLKITKSIGHIPGGFQFDGNKNIPKTTELFLANYAAMGMAGYQHIIEVQREGGCWMRGVITDYDENATYKGELSTLVVELKEGMTVPVEEVLVAPVNLDAMARPGRAPMYELFPEKEHIGKVKYEDLVSLRGNGGEELMVYLNFLTHFAVESIERLSLGQ